MRGRRDTEGGHEIATLFHQAFQGEGLGESDLGRLVDHIATAGFDPVSRQYSDPRLVGLRWRSQMLTESVIMSSAEVHFLRHVVARREWPIGTSLERYERSIGELIGDPATGIFASLYRGGQQFGFIRRSRELLGPEGLDWVLVEYRVKSGYWITAFQLNDVPGHLAKPVRRNVRWLRPAR